jgi:hypothetical protein
VLGLLVQATTPFGIIGRPQLLQAKPLLDSVNHARLERLDQAIVSYNLLYGTAPSTLDDVVNEGLADRSYLSDPWSRPYHYALTDGGYLLNAVDEGGKMVPGSLIERLLPRGPS